MTIGCETDGTPNDRNVERPNVTSRVTEHLFVAPCVNKGVDACNHHKCVAPCYNFVASHDKRELILMLSSLSLRARTYLRST